MTLNKKHIAIMQPTFMPWLGYFSLISSVDEFVFLDDVKFDYRSWQHRNKILTKSGEVLVTVPVKHSNEGTKIIKNVEISDVWQKNKRKFMLTLNHSYSRTPYYQALISQFEEIIENETVSLCSLNLKIINWACNLLNLKTLITLSSNLDAKGKKDIYLLNICKSLQASVYVSPPNSRPYLDASSAFKKSNIEIIYFM